MFKRGQSQRSGSTASPDMKDSVTKFKIPQTGANNGRASPLASSSESQLWLRVQRDIWHRRRECRLDLDLHVTKTINYGCSEVRFRQYAEKREDFSPNLFQDEYSTEDCSLRLPCREGLIQSLSLWSFDRNGQNQNEVQVWEELKVWELTLSLRFEGGINFSGWDVFLQINLYVCGLVLWEIHRRYKKMPPPGPPSLALRGHAPELRGGSPQQGEV